MFIQFLIFLSSSGNEFEVRQLDSKTFKKVLKDRQKGNVWVILLSNRNLEDESHQFFADAAKKSKNNFNFGFVDIRLSPKLSQKFDLSHIPAIFISHSKGLIRYEGSFEEKALLSTVYGSLDDFTIKVDKSKAASFFERPSCILFSGEPKSPDYWVRIALNYSSYPIKFGFCNDEETQRNYGAYTTPTYIFTDSGEKEIYPDFLEYDEIVENIEKFFAKRLTKPTKKIDGIYPPEDFENLCVGSRLTCILSTDKVVSQAFLYQKKANVRLPFLWFSGNKNLPYKFLETGGIWVYNAKRDSFHHVIDSQLLGETLDRVVDGTAKWVQRKKLIEENPDL